MLIDNKAVTKEKRQRWRKRLSIYHTNTQSLQNVNCNYTKFQSSVNLHLTVSVIKKKNSTLCSVVMGANIEESQSESSK